MHLCHVHGFYVVRYLSLSKIVPGPGIPKAGLRLLLDQVHIKIFLCKSMPFIFFSKDEVICFNITALLSSFFPPCLLEYSSHP